MYKRKLHNQKHMILVEFLKYIFQLHGVEEIQEGQLDTTICEGDLKELEVPESISMYIRMIMLISIFFKITY